MLSGNMRFFDIAGWYFFYAMVYVSFPSYKSIKQYLGTICLRLMYYEILVTVRTDVGMIQ